MPTGLLLRNLKAGSPFLKMLGAQMLAEVPSEITATAIQNFNEWANLHPEKPFSTYLDELQPSEQQTILQTAVATLLTAGLGHAAGRMARRMDDATNNIYNAETLAKLNELAKASKVAKRDPQTFQQFVEKASEDGPITARFH